MQFKPLESIDQWQVWFQGIRGHFSIEDFQRFDLFQAWQNKVFKITIAHWR